LKGETAAIDADLGNLLSALDEIEEDARKVELFGWRPIAAALLAALLLRLYLKTYEQQWMAGQNNGENRPVILISAIISNRKKQRWKAGARRC